MSAQEQSLGCKHEGRQPWWAFFVHCQHSHTSQRKALSCLGALPGKSFAASIGLRHWSNLPVYRDWNNKMSECLHYCFPLTPDPEPLNEYKGVLISGQCHLVTKGYRSTRSLGSFISAPSSAWLPAPSWATCGFTHVGNISYLV